MRGIINQMRVSGDSVTSVQAVTPNTVDDNRSSLLSILSKVRQQQQKNTNGQSGLAGLNAEERESIASFIKQQQNTWPQLNGLLGDDFQPNLQMFESMAQSQASAVSRPDALQGNDTVHQST